MRSDQTPKELLVNEVQIDRICGNVSDDVADEALDALWAMYDKSVCSWATA